MRPATAPRSSSRPHVSALLAVTILAGAQVVWAAGPAPASVPATAKPARATTATTASGTTAPATAQRPVPAKPAQTKPVQAQPAPAKVVPSGTSPGTTPTKAASTVVQSPRPATPTKPISASRPATPPVSRPATTAGHGTATQPTTAQSRAEQARMAEAVAMEREKIDSVVAASLVGAMTDELGGRPIKLRLEQLQVQPTSLRDRLVSGHGQVQIDGEEDWIDFRFNTLYDTLLESASYPEFHIGLTANGRVVPNDSALVRQLDDRVVGMLSEEFGYQHVRLQLDSISTTEAGRHYLRIDANGFADFGRDGVAPTRVEALYDRQRDRWLRVVYALEPSGTLPVPSSGPAATPAPLSR